MGAINIGARNGGKVKVVAPANPDVGAEATLPKHSGTLATLEDISSITDLDAEALVNLADQVEENKQDILELEEEIEAIAPSFDRGEWDFAEPETLPSEPLPKTYHILNEAGAVAITYANTHKVVFSNADAHEDIHTWADVEVGQYLEMFDERDGEFLLAKVDSIELETTYASFEVTVQKSDGGPRGITGEDDYSHRVRVKFFSLGEDVDLSSYMPIKGGTFTGKVTHTKAVDYKPTFPATFVTLKTYAPINPDTNDSDFTSAFGVNVDLDHGNTLSNSFKFSSRYGDILTVNGGTGPGAKYEGRITDEKHLVNKEYVDSRGGLITLASPGGGYKYVSSSSTPPSMGQFSANDSNTANNKEWHFYNMHDNNNLSVMCKDYEKTDTTMLEIWNQGTLRVRTTLKAWQPSPRSATCIQAICSGGKPSTALGATLSGTGYYDIIITNLRKKST